MEINPDEQQELEGQYLKKLFLDETEFMVAEKYQLRLIGYVMRIRVVRLIKEKWEAYDNSDIYVPFLALVCFDRYISRSPMEHVTNEIIVLMSISCISLAWKMRSSAFRLSDFLRRDDSKCQPQDVMKMEFQILSTIYWRLRSITALNFLDYFISFLKINKPRAESALKSLIEVQLVFKMYEDIKFAQFKPSIIAASAVLAYTIAYGQHSDCREDIKSCPFLKRGMAAQIHSSNPGRDAVDGDVDGYGDGGNIYRMAQGEALMERSQG